MSDIVKMTIGEARALSEFLAKLSETNPTLSHKIWLKLAKNARSLHTVNKDAEDVRMHLVGKYGSKKDGHTAVDDKNMVAFRKEYNDLQAEETNVELSKISISELEKEGNSFTGSEGVYLFYLYMVDESEASIEPETKLTVENA